LLKKLIPHGGVRILKLTDIEFGEIERLARIDLDPGQRDRLRIQLERIIGFVEQLRDVEYGLAGNAKTGSGTAPTADDPGKCLDREEVLDQAPDREGPFFRIPPVLEEDTGGPGS
jgi:aspartyl-tRNA(Asn)/glutamyl-tRNA(Gln) amidotransferase subunit C